MPIIKGILHKRPSTKNNAFLINLLRKSLTMCYCFTYMSKAYLYKMINCTFLLQTEVLPYQVIPEKKDYQIKTGFTRTKLKNINTFINVSCLNRYTGTHKLGKLKKKRRDENILI